MKTIPILCSSFLLLATAVSAIDPSVVKLNAQKVQSPDQNQFGCAVALNDSYMLVGEFANDDGLISEGGAVHVYSPATGLWLRKLGAALPVPSSRFGYAVALSGKIALIGAATENTNGAAYLFDVSTGKQVARLAPPVAGVDFGASVAIAGDFAVVGHAGAGSAAGALHVFNLKTGAFVRTITASDTVGGDRLGASVAADGSIIVAGAPNQAGNAGAAYLFDVTTGNNLGKLIANDQALNDFFGWSVAIAGGRSLIGAPYKSAVRGAAYLINNQSLAVERNLTASDAAPGDSYGITVALSPTLAVVNANENLPGTTYVVDVATGVEVRRLIPYGQSASAHLGWGESVALSGASLAIGARRETIKGGIAEEGAAYLFKGIVGPMPYRSLAMQGNYAPGNRVATFGKLGEGFVNEQGEVSFSATLSGVDSNKGKDVGIWSNLTGPLTSVARSRDLLPSLGTPEVASVVNIACNDDKKALLRLTLGGTGVTAANNVNLALYDGVAGIVPIQRTGDFIVGPNGPQMLSFGQVVQSRHDYTYAFLIRYKLGVNGVTVASDVAINLVTDGSGNTDVTEGRLEPGSAAKYGELSPRIAYGDSMAVWSGTRTGSNVTPATSRAVYKKSIGQSEQKVAQSDGQAIDVGLKFASFLGETSSQSNHVVVKNTITGTNVTAANNQMIFVTPGGIAWIAARTGTDVSGFPTGLKWKTFTNFWPLPDGAVLILGTVSGTGVNAANDQVLALFQQDNTTLILAREGDAAPGCPGLRIGTVARVDCSMGGSYAFVASLVGAAADSNLAMFIGNTFVGNPTTLKAARLPVLKLRKGTRFNTPAGTAAKVLSFSLPTTGTDATGAGGKGLGRAINNNGSMVFTLQLDDGTIQLVSATP